jgi:hypothetical protein
MLQVELREDRIHVGERFSVGFQRTLRIPDDGRVYPLPPGLGAFPVHRVEDYAGRVPASWRESGGYFISLYQREALWMGFSGALWKPNAVKIGVGNINAVSGKPWDQELHDDPQDYLVCPQQPWLDGINAGDGFIRQFIAMPLGSGYTVEGQLTGAEEFGGIQVLVYEPKPGRFPDAPPPRDATEPTATHSPVTGPPPDEMGLAAGGMIRQKIYPDQYGLPTWDRERCETSLVYIVNSEQYARLTGRKPPLTPISAQTYIERGFPWFDLYDEAEGDVARPGELAGVKSIREIDSEKGLSRGEEEGKCVPDSLVKKIRPSDSEKR